METGCMIDGHKVVYCLVWEVVWLWLWGLLCKTQATMMRNFSSSCWDARWSVTVCIGVLYR